jgi:hypothetical protein
MIGPHKASGRNAIRQGLSWLICNQSHSREGVCLDCLARVSSKIKVADCDFGGCVVVDRKIEHRGTAGDGNGATQDNGSTFHDGRLTKKLRGRAEESHRTEGAKSLSARGAKPQAHHGPLQRLLGCRGPYSLHVAKIYILLGLPEVMRMLHSKPAFGRAPKAL